MLWIKMKLTAMRTYLFQNNLYQGLYFPDLKNQFIGWFRNRDYLILLLHHFAQTRAVSTHWEVNIPYSMTNYNYIHTFCIPISSWILYYRALRSWNSINRDACLTPSSTTLKFSLHCGSRILIQSHPSFLSAFPHTGTAHCPNSQPYYFGHIRNTLIYTLLLFSENRLYSFKFIFFVMNSLRNKKSILKTSSIHN